jgi:hypothetical protein
MLTAIRNVLVQIRDAATDGTHRVIVDTMPPVTVDPPVGGATAANQATGNASLASVDGKLPTLVGGRVPVVLPAGAGGLTDEELRAAPLDVTGTVSVNVGLTDAQLRAQALAVSGTFWQATQPVSGTVAVSNHPSTMPVTGTFWQATQPVSGTFWQATQPVSGPLTDAQIRATALPVSGTVTVNVGVTDAQLRAAPVPVYVKDTGRVRCCIKFHAVAPATADTLLTLTKNLGGTETTGTSIGVTSAKRLRITAMKVSVKANAAAAAWVTASLRSNAAGATVIGSPILVRGDTGLTAAVANSTADPCLIPIPDGLEFSGAETLGVSLAAQAVTNIVSIELLGYEYTP